MVLGKRELESSDWHLLSKQQSLTILQGLCWALPHSHHEWWETTLWEWRGRVPTAPMGTGAALSPEHFGAVCGSSSGLCRLQVPLGHSRSSCCVQLVAEAFWQAQWQLNRITPGGSAAGQQGHGHSYSHQLSTKGLNCPCTKGTNTRHEACTKQTLLHGRTGTRI